MNNYSSVPEITCKNTLNVLLYLLSFRLEYGVLVTKYKD